jgi:hypothetical protein
MSNIKSKILALLNRDSRKVMAIETKLEFRKIKKSISDLHLGHHLRRFYLLFFILSCLIPLFAIKPSASIDNRFLQITNQFQVADNTPVTFAEPVSFVPTVESNFKSAQFQKYKIQTGENLDLLLARLAPINKESLEVNNPSKEFKADEEIIIPASNGLLIGFNKDTNFNEMAKALGKTEDEVKKDNGDQKEGYIFQSSDTPVQLKKDFDTAIVKLRTPIAVNRPITISQSYNYPSSDLSGSFSSFVANTQGLLVDDGNGWSMGQCVSLVKRWQNYIGAPSGYWPGNYPAPSYYSYINGYTSMAPYTPSYNIVIVSDANSLRAGDIVITTGYPSHTGIATGRVGGGSFDIYDQNNPTGSVSRFNTLGNGTFIGALRYVKS